MAKKKTIKLDTVEALDNFIQGVKKKYGKKAMSMRVEVHSQFVVDGEEHWGPNELSFLGVAKYSEDKINGYPEERVVVIR